MAYVLVLVIGQTEIYSYLRNNTEFFRINGELYYNNRKKVRNMKWMGKMRNALVYREGYPEPIDFDIVENGFMGPELKQLIEMHSLNLGRIRGAVTEDSTFRIAFYTAIGVAVLGMVLFVLVELGLI